MYENDPVQFCLQTCCRDLTDDGLPVGHLEGSQVSFNTIFSSYSVVNDLDVKLSHPTQDGLKIKALFQTMRQISNKKKNK